MDSTGRDRGVCDSCFHHLSLLSAISPASPVCTNWSQCSASDPLSHARLCHASRFCSSGPKGGRTKSSSAQTRLLAVDSGKIYINFLNTQTAYVFPMSLTQSLLGVTNPVGV